MCIFKRLVKTGCSYYKAESSQTLAFGATGAKMLAEVARVVDLQRGAYVCITLAQAHVLRASLHRASLHSPCWLCGAACC